MQEAFHMDIEGLDELVGNLTALRSVIEDKETLYEIIAHYMADVTSDVFEKGTSRYHKDPRTGRDWAEWSPSYIEHLKLLHKNNEDNMLKQSGHLLQSVMEWADAEGAHIGANAKYARLHQLGGTVKPKKKFKVKAHTRKIKTRTGEEILQNVREHESRGSERTIPARPYLGLDAQAREDIQQAIRDLLADALDG